MSDRLPHARPFRRFATGWWAIAWLCGSCAAGGHGGPADGGATADHAIAGDLGPADRMDPRVALCAGYETAIGGAAAPPFEVVQRIFDDNCVSCHSPGAALDLTQGHSFANIANHSAPPAESCGGVLIVPGDPGASYLFQKLTASHPCAGAQMPLDEIFASEPLPDCMIAILRGWIQAGAQPPGGSPSDAGSPGG